MRFIIALFFLLILSYFADAVFWFAADRLSYVLSANSMLGFIFLCFEVFAYFNSDKDSKYFRYRYFGMYEGIFKKTIAQHFEKIRKIRAGIFIAFLAINMLLAKYNLVLQTSYFCFWYFGIALMSEALVLCYASPKERSEYWQRIKKEQFKFSNSGLIAISGIVLFAGIFFWIGTCSEGKFIRITADNYETLMNESFGEKTSVVIRGQFKFPEQKFLEILRKCNPEKLKGLEITQHKLTEQSWEIIKTFKKLDYLRLWRTGIEKVPEFVTSFDLLETLDVGNNENLKELPSGMEKLKLLKKLEAFSCNLQSVPSGIGKCKNLRLLNLSQNPELPKIPDEITELKNLRWLYVSGCGLKKLPSDIGKLKNLEKLFIGGNPLESLDEICDLENLFELDISGCCLKDLPQNITKLKKLKRLNMDKNEFSGVPKQLWELNGLAYLDIGDGNLKTLPKEIGKLNQIGTIYLGRNQLESLPDEFSELKNLENLYLNDNKLKTLPLSLLKMTNLRELSLDGNQLSELPNDMEALFKKLKHLNISNNKFETRPAVLQKFKGTLEERGTPYTISH